MEALIEDLRPKLSDSNGLSDEEISESIVKGISNNF